MKRVIASRLSALSLQLGVMAVASAGAALLPLAFPTLNAPLKVILQWITLPLLGGATAGLVARSGLSHYLAWLPPPLIVSAVPWLIVGYPLQPGVMLLCCLVSMIGASTGEVLRRRAAQRRK
ncbi:MAG: hypothetical protein IKO07_10730 [Clostridia bacterium]|nr:hypothetical protein [Clostridia bacterium]